MNASLGRRGVLVQSGRGLRGFLAWWGSSLAEWLPARMRRALCGARRLLLQAEADGLRLSCQQGEEVRWLADLPLPLPDGPDPLARLLREDLRDWPRWLQLPAGMGLRRRLVLPAAAREHLREVLSFEIERQTPFAAGQALHDGRILQARDDGQLLVELVVVPRRQLDVLTERLGAAAARLAGVDMQDAAGASLGVNLLPPAERHRQAHPWRRWNLLLAVVAAVAVLLGATQLLDNRRAAAADLQATVAARAAQARLVASQRQRVLDAIEGGSWLRAQRDGRPASVEVLDALARRLPEGTYLEKLAIDGDQLTLIGLSNQAAALVGKLEGAPQWRAPALSGALQQDPRTRLDRFTLVAQLRHPPVAATVAQEPAR